MEKLIPDGFAFDITFCTVRNEFSVEICLNFQARPTRQKTTSFPGIFLPFKKGLDPSWTSKCFKTQTVSWRDWRFAYSRYRRSSSHTWVSPLDTFPPALPQTTKLPQMKTFVSALLSFPSLSVVYLFLFSNNWILQLLFWNISNLKHYFFFFRVDSPFLRTLSIGLNKLLFLFST